MHGRSLRGVLILTCLLLARLASAQDLAPGENLVVDGIPKFPAALPEEVGRYTQFRAAGFASWHPTQRRMLIRTRFADAYQIHALRMPGGARRQMTFYPDGIAAASYCPATGDYFIFAKDKGGSEFHQLYRFDLATGNITLLTDGKSRNENALWSHKGDHIAYTSTRRNGKDADIYTMDPTNPKSDRMIAAMDKPGYQIEDWASDDTRLLVTEYISVNESHLWIMNAANGEKTPLSPADEKEKVAYGDAQFSHDGNGVYFTTDKGADFQRLVYMDLASKAPTVLTPDLKWDVEHFQVSDDGKFIAFITNEDGLNVLHLMAADTRKEIAAPQFPAGQVSNLHWHKNNRDLAVNVVSARSTADVYSADVTTGRVDRWTESETGGLNVEKFSGPKLIRWNSFDDRQISGFLYQPSSNFAGKRPVIISIHCV